MTVKNESVYSASSSSTGRYCEKNSVSALALKRYLDLTLRGTRKSLADHVNKGKKDHPLSPYSFDRPDIGRSVQGTLYSPESCEEQTKPPSWVNQINSVVIKHDGEAPLFTENFLPRTKEEQHNLSALTRTRPLSGTSTKSAPIIINGAMYHRQLKKHAYLQASRRPLSAVGDRMTRASKLRNTHRSQLMSGKPSDSTKDDLQRLKDSKPMKHTLNKDLLPLPCHNSETPHSFIIGARYNCSNFMDSRSFSRLGLYVPRKNPLGTFLKVYKGEEATINGKSESEDDVEQTSVRTGGSSQVLKPSTQEFSEHVVNKISGRCAKPPIPTPRFRKVFKVAWLKEPNERGSTHVTMDEGSWARSGNTSPVPPHPSPKPGSYKNRDTEISSVSRSRRIVRSQRAQSTLSFAYAKEFRQTFDAHKAEMTDFVRQEVGRHAKLVSTSRRVAETE